MYLIQLQVYQREIIMKKILLIFVGVIASTLPLTASMLEDGTIDESGNTPFMNIVRDGYSCASLPVEHQTKEACRQNKLGQTPLIIALKYQRYVIYNLENLIKLPGHINLADKNGETAIFHAVRVGFWGTLLLDFMLQVGADVNRYNKVGDTPLHIVARRLDVAPRRLHTRTVKRAAKLLLDYDARSYYCNLNGKYPYQCTTDPELRDLLLTNKNKNFTLLGICRNWMQLNVFHQKHKISSRGFFDRLLV